MDFNTKSANTLNRLITEARKNVRDQQILFTFDILKKMVSNINSKTDLELKFDCIVEMIEDLKTSSVDFSTTSVKLEPEILPRRKTLLPTPVSTFVKTSVPVPVPVPVLVPPTSVKTSVPIPVPVLVPSTSVKTSVPVPVPVLVPSTSVKTSVPVPVPVPVLVPSTSVKTSVPVPVPVPVLVPSTSVKTSVPVPIPVPVLVSPTSVKTSVPVPIPVLVPPTSVKTSVPVPVPVPVLVPSTSVKTSVPVPLPPTSVKTSVPVPPPPTSVKTSVKTSVPMLVPSTSTSVKTSVPVPPPPTSVKTSVPVPPPSTSVKTSVPVPIPVLVPPSTSVKTSVPVPLLPPTSVKTSVPLLPTPVKTSLSVIASEYAHESYPDSELDSGPERRKHVKKSKHKSKRVINMITANEYENKRRNRKRSRSYEVEVDNSPKRHKSYRRRAETSSEKNRDNERERYHDTPEEHITKIKKIEILFIGDHQHIRHIYMIFQNRCSGSGESINFLHRHPRQNENVRHNIEKYVPFSHLVRCDDRDYEDDNVILHYRGTTSVHSDYTDRLAIDFPNCDIIITQSIAYDVYNDAHRSKKFASFLAERYYDNVHHFIRTLFSFNENIKVFALVPPHNINVSKYVKSPFSRQADYVNEYYPRYVSAFREAILTLSNEMKRSITLVNMTYSECNVGGAGTSMHLRYRNYFDCARNIVDQIMNFGLNDEYFRTIYINFGKKTPYYQTLCRNARRDKNCIIFERY